MNKGIETNLVQDIIFTPDIVEFQREVYYSPSQKKRFIAGLPPGYKGGFGPGLKSLVLTLYHDAHVSQPNILKLLLACGLSISASSISRMLIEQASLFHQEKQEIVDAGFQSTSFQHIDDTGARVNGKNYYVQVLCNPYYTAYFTTKCKDRLTILSLLFQGEMVYQFNETSFQLMASMGLGKKQFERLKAQSIKSEMCQSEVDDLLLRLFPNPKTQHKNRLLIQEAVAITAYQKRENAIKILVCDDAGQFKMATEHICACWVHEGRHYKKLKPIFKEHREALERFLNLFWELYHLLLQYKCQPCPSEAKKLSNLFDKMVIPTGYKDLDKRIQITASRKKELLLVLEFPEIEPHNNPAELAARAQARKRDVSLQTKNQSGTQAKDTMMTIIHTARKLGVSTYHYLYDRISKANKMISLSELIQCSNSNARHAEEKIAA